MVKSLKEENRRQIAIVLVANFLAFGALLAVNVAAIDNFSFDAHHAKPLIPAGIALILASLITDQFSAEAKARIVFWKWRDPLPASQAFSVLGPNDPRVSMQKIEVKLGHIPLAPDAQNKAWYSLYKQVAEEAPVRESHKRYLFNRDYACLALIFFVIMAPVALWQVKPIYTAITYSIVLLLQYLLARRAATQTGKRFVANALAAYM